jgi:menaquinone-9 beta-reductase
LHARSTCQQAPGPPAEHDALVQQWDVVVVGAGPAGASAALAARRADPTARVLMLDRAAFPRDKACGDGIAPEAFDVLADLGADRVDEGYGPVRDLRIDGPNGAHARRRMARPARVIPREVLDARIVGAALAAGAEMQRRTVRQVRRSRGGVVVDDSLHAHVLIAADGASGTVTRALGMPQAPAGHTAVAVRGYVAHAPTDGQRIVMDAGDRWPAYAWSFPLTDGTDRANVGYGVLVDAARPVTRAEMLQRLHDLMPWTRSGERWRGHLLPLSSWTPPQPDGRVLRVGDAAHRINPLTGEGIWYAIRSGTLAGHAAVTAPREGVDVGARYRGAERQAMGRHTRHVRLLSRFGRTPRLVDAGVAAAGEHQAAFDDLVAMGLTAGVITPRLALRTGVAAVRGRRT